MRRVTGLALGFSALLTSAASAQEPAATTAPAEAPAATTPAEPAAPPAPPVYPPGPFWEAVSKGDAAYAARDFEGSIESFRAAIEKEPNNPIGHYRLGEALVGKGDLTEAALSFEAGLRFVGADQALRSKVMFRLADVREREKNYDDADVRWKEYATHVKSQPEAKGFPATAVERQKRIAEWKKISADSAAVKERIEKRMKETEESMRKSSK